MQPLRPRRGLLPDGLVVRKRIQIWISKHSVNLIDDYVFAETAINSFFQLLSDSFDLSLTCRDLVENPC